MVVVLLIYRVSISVASLYIGDRWPVMVDDVWHNSFTPDTTLVFGGLWCRTISEMSQGRTEAVYTVESQK